MHIINIIPDDYEGDPRQSLAYGWTDFDNQAPGEDVRLERTPQGFQVIEYLRDRFGAEVTIAAVDFLHPPQGRVVARVVCLWAGGPRLAVCLPDGDEASDEADVDADGAASDVTVDADVNADGAMDAIDDNVDDDAMDAAYAVCVAEGADDPIDDDSANAPCPRCSTWCYGDCQAP